MRKFTVKIDEVRYRDKPEPADVAQRLTPNLKRIEPRGYTLEEIRDCLIHGQTVLPIETRKQGNLDKANWKSQHLFFLDFDKGYTLDELRSDCQRYGFYPALVYTTFSHTASAPRFRAVFVNEFPVTDRRLRTLVVELLYRLFPSCDVKVKNENRFFYGGRSEVLYNPAAEIHPVSLLGVFYREICGKSANGGTGRIKALANATNVETFGRPLSLRVQLTNSGQPDSSGGLINHENPVNCVESCKDINKVYIPAENHAKDRGYWVFLSSSRRSQAGEIASKSTRGTNGREDEYPVPVESELPTLTEGDKALLLDRCQLMTDFMSGERKVDHPDRLRIIGNLRWRRRGVAWFREGVATRAEYQPDTLEDSAKRHNFQPVGCDGCPHRQTCPAQKKNILQLLPVRWHEFRKLEDCAPRFTLDDARERLSQALRDAYTVDDTKVYVIAADCGVGKSEALLGLPLENTYVGFPTHRLKDEMYRRALAKGMQPYLWLARPTLPEPFEEKVKQYERIGGISIAETVEQLMPEFTEDKRAECASWLECLRAVNTKSLIFGTHEKAHSLSSPNINTYVFDEDVTRGLLRTELVTERDIDVMRVALRKLRTIASEDRDYIDRFLVHLLNTSITMPQRNNFKVPLTAWNDLTLAVMDRVTSPLAAMAHADFFLRKPGGMVLCGQRRKLVEGKKHIILSATADETFYRMLFGDRLVFLDVRGATPAGKLILHPERSLSRQSISEMGELKFRQKIKGDQAKYGFEGIVTFKGQAQRSKNGLHLRGDEMPVVSTFGATEGIDEYRGKCIAVYGTPHFPVEVYAMQTYLATGTWNERWLASEAAVATIERNGYEFRFMTFDDETLRNIQLHLIESELMQAAGRNRYMSEDATVHLFGNFPIPGVAVAA